MDWSALYPKFVDDNAVKDSDMAKQLDRDVTIADIGCGFGGLLMALSPMLPEELAIGLHFISECFLH